MLIDAATRRAPRRILKQIEGYTVTAHALTHAHPDHQGASAAICDRLGIPYRVGGWPDVPLAEDLDKMRETQAPHPLNRLIMKYWCGPARHVDRHLREGDEVAGLLRSTCPATARHIAYWREPDRVLILGDVLNNMDVVTGVPGLKDLKPFFTNDPALNRRSAKRLALLEPRLVLFGHGRRCATRASSWTSSKLFRLAAGELGRACPPTTTTRSRSAR